MKFNGKPFYCPNSGGCSCASSGRKKPSKQCAGIAKGLSKRKKK